MNKIFKQWSKDLIPVNLSLDEKNKKIAKPRKWKNGETYTNFNQNTIAMRTGSLSVNVIDVDTKDIDLLTEPLKSWVEDRMMYEDTLTVETAQGFHFYFKSEDFKLRSTTKTGANKSEIPFIDFRGEGGLIFIHSTTEFANYEVICDAPPMEMDKDVLSYLPQYEERPVNEGSDLGFTNLDDPTDTDVLIPNPKGETEMARIETLLSFASSDTDRDTWMSLMAGAYSMSSDKKAVIELLREWSKKSDSFTLSGFKNVVKQLKTGEFGVSHNGGSLVNAAVEGKVDNVLLQITTAQNMNELEKLFVNDWAVYPHPKEEDIEKVAQAYKKKGTDFKGSVFKIDDAREIVGFEIQPETPEEVAQLLDTTVYLDGKDYFLESKGKLSKGMGLPHLKETCKIWEISKPVVKKITHPANIIPIQGIREETSYLTKDEVTYTLSKSDNPSELSYLDVLTNPLYKIDEHIYDPEVNKEFFEDIWNGKVEDIIKIVGLTLRFASNKKKLKLNKIMLVAPSDSGKSEIIRHIGFGEIHLRRLLAGMRGDKGIGGQAIADLKSSGLMLIDEVNKPLPDDIKNMDDHLYIDEFGARGGTQKIKIHFTAMTSTHKTATRTTSDELYNRVLQVELSNDEMAHTVTKGPIFREEGERYSIAVASHCRFLLKDAITNHAYTEETLSELQGKYRLKVNNDIDDVLHDISVRVIANMEASLSDTGDVIVYRDEYYIKRKNDLSGTVADMLGEIAELDVGKYQEKLVDHFMPDDKRKSIRINGRAVKYYPLILKPYYATDEEAILEEFDDLDQQEFED